MEDIIKELRANPSWICGDNTPEHQSLIFEKTIALSAKPIEAVAAVAVIGVYAFTINGESVRPGVLEPGIFSAKRVLAERYDITPYLKKGDNTIRFELAEGWAIGDYGDVHAPVHNHYLGTHLALAVRFCIGQQVYQSDASFLLRSGSAQTTGIYYGEDIDLEAKCPSLGFAHLDPSTYPAIEEDTVFIEEHEVLNALAFIVTPSGDRVIDFGQNLAGYPEILTTGKKGEVLDFDFAEVLDKRGEFYRDNYRSARSELKIVCDGEKRWIKPRFSYFGYRYMRLKSYPQKVELSAFHSIAVYSAMKSTFEFDSANPLVNKLYQNVLWSQKSNFLSIPTDCPQRDERLGWTGDAQIFAPTAVMNFDCKAFYLRWLRDLCLEQKEDGGIPGVCPDVLRGQSLISAGWADVITFLPHELYQTYGDLSAYRLALPAMKRWVRFMRQDGPEEYLWLKHPHYGDWLALDGGEAFFGLTQRDFTASAYFYKSAQYVEEAMGALGEQDSEFVGLSAKIKSAFLQSFFKNGLPTLYYPDEEARRGRIEAGITQTSLSLALVFHLYRDENQRQLLAQTLHAKLLQDGMRITAGFIGTSVLFYALSENGFAEDAYRLLLNRETPGWLYSVDRGATSVWESYDGILPNGDFRNPSMNSFNHYSHGAVLGWLYQEALGIHPAAPGYQEILLSPKASPLIPTMKGRFLSPVGPIASSYIMTKDQTEYTFDVPAVPSRALLEGKVRELQPGRNTFIIKNH